MRRCQSIPAAILLVLGGMVLLHREPLLGQQSPPAAPHQLPTDSTIPNDDVGAAIRRGLALLSATRDSLPRNVGNRLRCVSCHPDAGRRSNAMPWIGVYGRFPQYRSRAGRVMLLEDRINDCFRRSMNGTALSNDGPDMRDIVAYMAFLSRGIPVGATVPGQGLPKLPPLKGSRPAGAAIYVSTCARCHGANGGGTTIAPPLWGPQSYNVGAGMARIFTAAAFIRYNMPFDRPGSLTDQQAVDVATYVNSRSRPDFKGKELDWPKGDPPPDSPYRTRRVPKPTGTSSPAHRSQP